MQLQELPSQQKLSSPQIADYVTRWGGSPSIALLDPRCQIFTSRYAEGVIGYRLAAGAAFVFGEPVCDPALKVSLALEFEEHCKKHKKNIVYTQVSQEFGDWGVRHYNGALIEVGHDFFVDPHLDPTAGRDARMLRKKVKHALTEGTSIHEYTSPQAELEQAMEQAKQTWLKGRKGPQIYLSNIHLFNNRSGKRWFYAIKGNRLVGQCMLNQLEARGGWVINLLMATPEASGGTTELLVVSILEQLRKENCQYLTFGMVPLDKIDRITGLSAFSNWFTKTAFKGANWMFKLDGKRKYWQKYKPYYESSHLLFTNKKFMARDMFGLMRAMNARF
ncbi:phosphatidylglycerol lysyltransferase domain-containing protein [Neochlamydia sp. AcF84]|uniref:phosphatidylglycerol lysyltransferase domain-containing protein n=1 Tax=Neochlamydia sp. AcF84 TaxID=2315858 RepID=UPI0014076E03|nr:phosphatidylglycerol lysyltransferase domain-containing protein [Neochlamydia sp. AcF84]